MEFQKTEKTAFEIERDRRLKILMDNSLWQILREKVMINGKPISHRTARNVFSLSSYNEVKIGTPYRVWIASEAVVDEYEKNENEYGFVCKTMESSITD